MDIKEKQLTPEELEMISGGLVVVCPGFGFYVVDDGNGDILYSAPHLVEAYQLAMKNGIDSHAISVAEYEQRFGRNILDLI